MKKKSLLLSGSLVFLALGALAGCAGNQKSLTVWVGSESVKYYRQVVRDYKKINPDFNLNVTIVGADTGGAAGQMIADNTACGDVVTIAHDNIGKLSQLNYIAPIVDPELLDQVGADNPDGFKKVINNYLGDDTKHEYTFAVPYISQALFLYYDTRYVTDEEADTFEGLVQAAKRYDQENKKDGTKAFTVTGTDGYNYSFSVLARNLSNGNTSALRLYENGERFDCYNQFNDQVAVIKWMQRMLEDNNGVLLESDSPWSTNIENHIALSVIGGAWHYNSFQKAVTDKDGVHMGCKIIPTFTLTAADVEGIQDVNYPNDTSLPEALRGIADPAPKAGDKFRGGSFVDCKAFVINMAAINGDVDKYYEICKMLKYFSSKEVQQQSFIEALNVPAYEGSDEFIEAAYKDKKVSEEAYLMASAQTGMGTFGIPQPFVNGTLNTFYYSKNAPDYYLQCIKKTKDAGGDSVDGIRKVLFRMEYVWKHGTSPRGDSAYPTTFPAETTTDRK